MIVTVSTEDAKKTTKELARKGLLLGISSGAAVSAARNLLSDHPDKAIVAIAPDGGLKYLSTGVYR
jgi:cysteine synthase A